jgi:hypothetical protein
MIRCPGCRTTTNPLRHLTVTPRRPYRCSGCGEDLVAAPSVSAFAGLFVAWLLVFQVLDLLGLPLPLRVPLVAGAAVLLLWLMLPLRTLRESSAEEESDGSDQP